ncbi:hypothetical protein V8C35DRAFT_49119 [Trichoderma chlorosporum]
MRLFQSQSQIQSQSQSQSSSRHKVAPPQMFPCYRFPPPFPHHHLPLARAESPDRSPFCLALVPTADSIGSSSPKEEALLGLGAYLIALFDCACPRNLEAITTTDIPRRGTTIFLTSTSTRTSAKTHPISGPFRTRHCDKVLRRRPIAQYSIRDLGLDTLAAAHLVTSHFSRGICRPFV